MGIKIDRLRLAVQSPLINESSENFRPATWPPADDFPIVIDKNGIVVSRYGDAKWDLSCWEGRPLTISFNGGATSNSRGIISPENARLLRQVSAWLFFGRRSVSRATTIVEHIKFIKPFFILCSQENILASALYRFPAVVDKAVNLVQKSRAESILSLLHTLFERRSEIGFTLFDREGLRRIAAGISDHENQQTAYIPSRIWTYQLSRLRLFLDDFLSHQEQIENLYHFCLGAYSKNYGSLQAAYADDRNPHLLPFTKSTRTPAHIYYGTFGDAARKFGVDGILQRWCALPGQSLRDLRISTFGSYFSNIQRASIAYLINFSLMRINEACALRSNCLQIEDDPSFGAIYLLCGPTAKSIQDDDARWVTSPSAKIAVDAANVVARLRLEAAKGCSGVLDDPKAFDNPPLLTRSYEPWAMGPSKSSISLRFKTPNYGTLIENCRNLFDPEVLRITESDLEIARRVTPTLDGEIFAVGKIWPLAWHQLRRTGMVNMQASGIVSEASAQYQAKHACRSMSLYYGQGFSEVALNESARKEYIRTMYEMMGKEIRQLFSDRFLSPYGSERKAEVLRLLDPKDAKNLVQAGKTGQISCRQTLLGVCTRRGPCEYGGIDNIIRCGGGDGRGACNDALIDFQQLEPISAFVQIVDDRIADTPADSPLYRSLIAQKRALENAIAILTKKKQS
ncbi:hypothetical protein SAMN05443245_7020 [Paraburkholderia fungorum]|uniref:Integrase n=1 Tax=Paraburkholderia fungorum TaxID=134537 RepID=A0A1H1JP98_9BURK|nr:hypothetical protein [Paraburkholderia fungorum]SDR51782.1 hypothetical protein SAMN05443245_7020 [Paraburkholderia fungorum]